MPIYALHDHSPSLPEQGRYWIAPSAEVIGNVRLGLDVGIWFGAVLRGDNEPIEVGDRTNIQEGAMLHADPGFPLRIGCRLHHRASRDRPWLHHRHELAGRDGGNRCSTARKSASNCLVGARALVTEGKEFPDNSLIVGAPAKLVRTLDEEAFDACAGQLSTMSQTGSATLLA